jgi:hypothetical protein
MANFEQLLKKPFYSLHALKKRIAVAISRSDIFFFGLILTNAGCAATATSNAYCI